MDERTEIIEDRSKKGGEGMKHESYMIAIPLFKEELDSPTPLIQRLENSKAFEMKRMEWSDEDDMMHVDIEYNGRLYKFRMQATDLDSLEDIQPMHPMKDTYLNELRKRGEGLNLILEFSDDALESFHLQLKIIDVLFPRLLAVLDVDATNVLSGRWVNMAAETNTHPAPKYLFGVHAVYNSDEDVWLHTHGLSRCGTKELEVLGTTKDTYNSHYEILHKVACRLIEDPDELGDEGDFMHVGCLCGDVDLVVTWVPWQEAVETIPEEACGGKNDRIDDDGLHTGYTGALFVFPTEEDYKNGQYKPLSVYDNLMQENPVLYFSNKETRRMSALAQERISYMKRAFSKNDAEVLVKVGIKVDEEYANETNDREHIWFLLKDVGEDSFTAEMTHEAYWVNGIHEGDVKTYPYSMVTDWVAYLENGRIVPDDVYLLDEWSDS